MEIVAKIGFRTYVFENLSDLSKAREIYAQSAKDQNGFEDELEENGIDFVYGT